MTALNTLIHYQVQCVGKGDIKEMDGLYMWFTQTYGISDLIVIEKYYEE